MFGADRGHPNGSDPASTIDLWQPHWHYLRSPIQVARSRLVLASDSLSTQFVDAALRRTLTGTANWGRQRRAVHTLHPADSRETNRQPVQRRQHRSRDPERTPADRNSRVATPKE